MDLLQHLQIFQRVAESGSFSRAANQMGLAPSSVSAAVQKLELHLGVKLFLRTTRQVRLSSDGELLYTHSLQFLAEADAIGQLFHTGERPAGLLRVEVPARMARLQLAPALPAFLETHPGASIDFGGTDRISDLVSEGIDCVLRVGELGNLNLAARHLGHLAQVTCASPALLARYPSVSHLDEVSQLPAIHFGRMQAGKPESFQFGTHEGVVERPAWGRVSVSNAETYIACALSGLGMIQVPRYDVADLLVSGTLVEVLPGHPPPGLPLTALYPPQQRASRLLHAFIDWVEALMAPYCDRQPSAAQNA